MRHSKWIRKRPVKKTVSEKVEINLERMKCISKKIKLWNLWRESSKSWDRRTILKGVKDSPSSHLALDGGRMRNKGVKFRSRINHDCLREWCICARACLWWEIRINIFMRTNCEDLFLDASVRQSSGPFSHREKCETGRTRLSKKKNEGYLFFCSSLVAIWSRARRDETSKTK